MKVAGILLFAAAVAVGTLMDARAARPAPRAGVLVADLHVHPYPGDGALTVGQLRREARRRGIDVLAITGHNNRYGLQLSAWLGVDPEGPIVLEGQEVTSVGFHMIAAGTSTLIDWRLPAAEAVAAVHAQGGVAIAAHPLQLFGGWTDAAVSGLDGTEVAHPVRIGWPLAAEQLDRFNARVQSRNPGAAVIGSTDFHMTAPLGRCRTYLATADRSAAGALGAIRDGRASAECLPGSTVPWEERLAALAALAGLFAVVVPLSRDGRRDQRPRE